MADILHIDGQKYQNAAEVAGEFGISEKQVAVLGEKGLVRTMRVGDHVYVQIDSLKNFLAHPPHLAEDVSSIPSVIPPEEERASRIETPAESVPLVAREVPAPTSITPSPPTLLLPVAGALTLTVLFVVLISNPHIFSGVLTFTRSGGEVAGVAESVGQIETSAPTSVSGAVLAESTSTLPQLPATVVQNYITQPIIERVVVEQAASGANVSEGTFNTALQQLENKLTAMIYGISASNSSNSTQITNVIHEVAQSQRIDKLGGVDIDGGSTWTGGTISGATVTGGSVTATAFSGTLGVGSGGTGLTSTPSYGQLLVGNASSGYTLTATSSLGLSGVSLSDANTWSALQLFSSGASTTALSVFNNAYFGATATSTFTSTGALGIASSSPWALLSINPNAISGPAFAIGSSTATNFVVDNRGYVGVGTSTPGTLFSVNNSANFVASATSTILSGLSTPYISLTGTSASSTAANGINLTAGCFAVNGTCLPSADTVVRLSAIRSYTSSTAWSKPSDISYAVVEVWGGGGGGGGAGNVASGGGGGGGGGGYAMETYTSSTLSATSSVYATIGAAGTTVSATGGGTGGSGGTSNFGGMATSTGGAGGVGGNNNGSIGFAGGAGGTGSGGDVNLTGTTGSYGGNLNSTDAFQGGGGMGGSAPRGGGGGSGAVSSTAGQSGSAGQVPGGGGGGQGGLSASSGASGAGAAGMIIVYEYTTVTSGTDLAENYPTTDPTLGAGDLVQVDGTNPISIKRADKNDPSPLIGIISTQPGLLLSDEAGLTNNSGQRPVALSGRVPTRVNLEHGPIAIGDRIALSSEAGVGMKAGPLDPSVGIALEPYDVFHENLITVFMDLQPGVNVEAIGEALLAGPAASTTATSTTQVASVSTFVRGLFAQLIAWFADAANGIKDFFAERIYTKELCISDDTGSSTCITRSGLDSLLASPAASFGSGEDPAASTPPAPPPEPTLEPAPSPDSIASDTASSTEETSPPQAAPAEEPTEEIAVEETTASSTEPTATSTTP